MNLDQALRDAAEPVPARVGQAPAQALLDQIVNSPAHPAPAPARTRRTAWRPRKTVIAVLAAAVAATAALTLPNLGPAAAYASWTAKPSPLAAADQANLADRCVARVAASTPEYTEQNRAARIVHGEQRGDYAYLSVVTPGWSASCFRDRDGVVRDASIIVDPLSTAALGRKGIDLQAWPQWHTREGYCRLMTGHVGSQVTGVDITVRGTGGDSRVVHATVDGGYFLAWYPEGLAESGSNRTSLTLRLADGSTVGDLSARDLMDAPVRD
jgi:hypothetical protein